jgi:hypothetical protein
MELEADQLSFSEREKNSYPKRGPGKKLSDQRQALKVWSI